jgi:cyclophilin family peptidyl-prolyl cis-trans isomerase/HEAT repeat protein
MTRDTRATTDNGQLTVNDISPIERSILEAEHTRSDDVSALLTSLKHPDPRIQRLAVRALGRLERDTYHDAVVPLLHASDAGVRKEAVNALGQMHANYEWPALLREEQDGPVRGVIYETIGRITPTPNETEALLVRGLSDGDLGARIGAAKGLESLFRLNATTLAPSAETIEALRQAIWDNDAAVLRELALLTLNAAGDRDAETLAIALRDPNPQVRRLAVLGLKRSVDDPSPIVRYAALTVAANCERALEALADPSEHVVLLAVDLLGSHHCAASALEQLVDSGTTWRIRAHALVSLAHVAPDSARRRLPAFVGDPTWQARVYAANAAKLLQDSQALATLVEDANPNVVAAALARAKDAIRALDSDHYGLLLQAARLLRGASELPEAVPQLLAALRRITREQRATSRDPRLEILERLREAGDQQVASELHSLLSDLDPAIASRAAEIIVERTGVTMAPQTQRYIAAPLPPESFMRRLTGATARITITRIGMFTIQLFPEEAPATVATFVELAERGYYNGLTFHRVVPNFVLQGGSPGADEFDGIGPFMRDEVGLLSHMRGSLGISTRGRDTGDAQIFVDLIDNFRLDHLYTVFARVTEGMQVVDTIQEGDVIESIQIQGTLSKT